MNPLISLHTQLSDAVIDIHWQKDSPNIICTTADGHINLINQEKQDNSMQVHTGAFSLFSSSVGATSIAVGLDNGKCKLYDSQTLEFKVEMPCKAKWVEHVLFNADASMLAVAAGTQLQIFDGDFKLILEYNNYKSTIQALAWNSSGNKLATACFGGAHIFEPNKQQEPLELLPWQNSIVSLAWSADDKFICGGTQDCSLHFWSLPYAPDTDFEMNGFESKVKLIQWNKKQNIMATPNVNQLVIWPWDGKPPIGKQPKIFADLDAKISAMAFQHESSAIAAGDLHGNIVFYEPTYKQEVLAKLQIAEEPTSMKWSKNDFYLAIGTRQGSLFIIDSPL